MGPDDQVTAKQLRVAVLVEAPEVPAWIAALVARLEAAPTVELGVHAVGQSGHTRARKPALLAIYERIDRRLFRGDPDALEPVEVAVQPVPESFDGYDVVVDFVSAASESRAAGARFGVWALTHDLDERPPLERMSLRAPPGTRVYRMQIDALLGDGRCVAVHTSYGALDPTSLHRTRNQALWKAESAFAHRLETVRRLGEPYLAACPAAEAETLPRLSNRVVARGAAASALGVLSRRARALREREAWFVAARPFREPEPEGVGFGAPDGFEPLELPRAAAADPFVLRDGDATYVFFEDDDPRTRRGHISYARIDADGRVASEPETALARPYHLSYPFVFRHAGEVFLIPESSANGTVELYRADPFPASWALEHVLLRDVQALDATLHDDGDRFWLFACLTTPGASPNDDLHLWSATALAGPWLPHPLNPVVSDARSARPAGRIFRRGRDLIRPSQDCSQRYGFAIVFNRIDVLAEEDYRETPIARIDPGWRPGVVATHTYNFGGGVEVIDGIRYVPAGPLRRRRA